MMRRDHEADDDVTAAGGIPRFRFSRRRRPRAVARDRVLPAAPRDPPPRRRERCGARRVRGRRSSLWLALLFEGKAPRSLQGFVASYLRYSVHVSAYMYLAADPYPRVRGRRRHIPIDVEIEPVAAGSRAAGSPARLVLALPALLLAARVGGGSWFVDTSWATSAATPDWSLVAGVGGGSPRRRRARLVRSLAAGTHAPRACATWSSTASATRRRRRLPAARHRPLSDDRPRPGASRTASCRRTRCGSSSPIASSGHG